MWAAQGPDLIEKNVVPMAVLLTVDGVVASQLDPGGTHLGVPVAVIAHVLCAGVLIQECVP